MIIIYAEGAVQLFKKSQVCKISYIAGYFNLPWMGGAEKYWTTYVFLYGAVPLRQWGMVRFGIGGRGALK